MPSSRKKIIMYFKKDRLGKDPFSGFGEKRDVYHYFFQKGKSMGFDMFLASGKNAFIKDTTFRNAARFDGHSFSLKRETIKGDAVYDRSGGTKFPPKNEDEKILNCSAFKVLCNDKNLMYQKLARFMPKSFKIDSQKELSDKLENFDSSSLIVLKPAKGLGGKGIVIEKKREINKIKLADKNSYILQEFIDTSCGIPKITEKNHDLRVVIVNGKIVLSHVRTPREGSFLANAAQGGTLGEVPLEKIPKSILEVTKKIQMIIDKKYGFPIYSIDFGLTKKGPLVFELNDQIGFPRAKMRNAKKFINELLISLSSLSKI